MSCVKTTVEHVVMDSCFHIRVFKQGRPPQESERGPYAVVNEQCEDTTLDPSIEDLLQRTFLLLFGP